MSLSASTCLTYTGTTPLGQTLYVFSNVDAYSTYFTTIPLLLAEQLLMQVM